MKKKRGFTLIEVIMIVFILGIVVVVGGNLFFSVLKGASKAEITKEVKQNGDYAIGVMERMIRNAQEIVPNSCSGGSIQIKNPDGYFTTFSFSGTRIASNSAYLTSENVKLVTGSYSFSCSQTVPLTVTISFTLSQTATTTRPEEQAQVPFQTTVSLRTY